MECLGTAAFRLPLAEEIVFLCAHAGKPHHAFSRLVWIADLAMIATPNGKEGDGVDWDHVQAVAREGSCETLVAAGLALARHAGVTSPAELFPLPDSGWRGEAIRQLTQSTWPLTYRDLPGYHLNYALADTTRLRLRILLVLLASGHAIGTTVWRAVDAVQQLPRSLRHPRQGRRNDP
jgi:hypothetical protein